MVAIILASVIFGLLAWQPQESSLKSSSNDIVFGGGTNQNLASAYRAGVDDAGRTDIAKIYDFFEIDSIALAAAQASDISPKSSNYFWMISRTQTDSTSQQIPIKIDDLTTLYMQPLRLRISPATKKVATWRLTNPNGQRFWIAQESGNIIIKNAQLNYLDVQLDVWMDYLNPQTSELKNNDQINYLIGFRNSGPGQTSSTRLSLLLPRGVEPVSSSMPFDFVDGSMIWPIANQAKNPLGLLGASDWYNKIELSLKFTSDFEAESAFCPRVTIDAQNASLAYSDPKALCLQLGEVPVSQAIDASRLIINQTLTRPNNQALVFTTSLTNLGSEEISDYQPPAESIGDVLDYAKLVDAGQATFDQATSSVVWPKINLDGNQTISNLTTFELISPPPSTPISNSDYQSYDSTLTKAYADNVDSLSFDQPLSKYLEAVALEPQPSSLSTNLLFSLGLSVVAAYFYFRARLISKQMQLLRKEFHG